MTFRAYQKRTDFGGYQISDVWILNLVECLFPLRLLLTEYSMVRASFNSIDSFGFFLRHFPDLLKNHSSHDVVLLCINCHSRSNVYDGVLRRFFSECCNAPIGTEEGVKVFGNPELKKVKSAAR